MSLDAEVGARFDKEIMPLSEFRKNEFDPKLHLGVRPVQWMLKQELDSAKKPINVMRRSALKNMLIKEFHEVNYALRFLGLTYAGTFK